MLTFAPITLINVGYMRHIMYALLVMCLAACGAKQEAEVENAPVAEVRDLNKEVMLRITDQQRLHVAEYTVHKIVTHDDLVRLRGKVLGIKVDETLALGDRKIAIPIDAVISGYIDFSAFDDSQVEIKGKSVHLTLPDPRFVLVSSKVDHDATRQYVSLFRSSYTDKEMSEFTKQGLESLLRQVDRQQLLSTARTSAATQLIPLLADMGFERDSIVVTFRSDLQPKSISIERRNK